MNTWEIRGIYDPVEESVPEQPEDNPNSSLTSSKQVKGHKGIPYPYLSARTFHSDILNEQGGCRKKASDGKVVNKGPGFLCGNKSLQGYGREECSMNMIDIKSYVGGMFEIFDDCITDCCFSLL